MTTAAHTSTPAIAEAPAFGSFRGTLTSALITPSMFGVAARGFETCALLVLGTLIAQAYVPAAALVGGTNYILAPIVTVLIATSIFQAFGLYAPAMLRSPLRVLGHLCLGWTVAVAALLASLFFLKIAPDFSRVWLATWYGTGLVCLTLGRVALMVITRAASRAGHLTRSAIIYGSGGSSEALIAQLQSDPNSDVRICGVFDDRSEDRSITSIGNIPCLGNIDALKAFSRSEHVDMLIMALPLAAETRVTMLMQRVTELPIDIRLAATASTLRFHKSAYSYIGSVPVIDLCERPISGWDACAKWLFDKTIAMLAIVLLAPLMAIVAAAVKIESKGPAIFRQKRYGFNNELIEVYKFRSMYTDRADATATKLVTKNDPRVTRVGRLIRKSSLDELPQLFNVLCGTLSLVGPRPHAMQAKAADRLYPDVVDGYFARHKVKPGITGWAQINGWRGETDTHEKIQKRVAFDLDYIENWSVWFDLYILAKTPVSLMSTDNAY